jgi:hypothetical protein
MPDDNNDGGDDNHLSIYLSVTAVAEFKAHTVLEHTKYGISGSKLC